MTIAFYGACALIGLIMLIYYGRTQRPVRSALWGMVSGAVALFGTSYIGAMFGVILPVNVFTAFMALTLGLPGVTVMLISLIL